MAQQNSSSKPALRVPLYDAELQAKPTTICVTGATGYVAGAIVSRLLAAGHTVHGTASADPASDRLQYLRDMPGAGERLRMFQADLTVPKSFHAAVLGCEYVIHVASPISVTVRRGQGRAALVEPAIAGVENVLAAVNDSGGSVRAVVLTSSVAAARGDNWEGGADHVCTEADWNQSATDYFLPYARSKTLAERRAWELHAAQPEGTQRWRLVALLPGFVLGPPAGKQASELVQFAVDLLAGKFRQGLPNLHFPNVDLDDVAAAHTLAMLNPDATGRYILAHGDSSCGFLATVTTLRPRFSAYHLPSACPPKWVLWVVVKLTGKFPWDLIQAQLNKPFRFDGTRAPRELGFAYHDPAQGLADLCERVLQLGLAPRRE